jgi:hypothetical protein
MLEYRGIRLRFSAVLSVYFFCITSRQALRPCASLPPVRQSGQGVNLTSHLHLMPRLGIPLPIRLHIKVLNYFYCYILLNLTTPLLLFNLFFRISFGNKIFSLSFNMRFPVSLVFINIYCSVGENCTDYKIISVSAFLKERPAICLRNIYLAEVPAAILKALFTVSVAYWQYTRLNDMAV